MPKSAAAAISPDELKLRPAIMADAETLWRWKNDPDTRANSANSDEVPWNNHIVWLEAAIASDDMELLVAELGGAPVGTVRVDQGSVMSWTVAPEARGRGVGKAMVCSTAFPGAVAHIKSDNAASQRVALAAGFRLVRKGVLQVWRVN